MNIVLAVVDTLRADHLSAYGYGRATSPNLEALAAEGVRVARCFAQNNATHPSFTTIMTGLHPLRHGVVGHMGQRVPDPRLPMLAEVLRAHGYATAAVDTLERWFRRGFEVYRSYAYDQRAAGPLRSGEQVNSLALPLLDELSRSDRPFFLFLHYWDPHSPYLPPAPYDTLFSNGHAAPAPERRDELERAYHFAPLARYLRGWIGDAPDLETVVARYDGEVAYVDRCIGALLGQLDRLNLREETLVAVTGDHGESLGEHGIYFDHHGLYDQQLHVPLLLRCPALLPAGVVVDGLARHTDLAPTLLDLAGLGDALPACDGASLRGRIAGDGGPANEALLACEATWQLKMALRRPDWKLITALRPDEYGTPPLELYDLAADPAERHNLAARRPDVVAELRAELNAMAARALSLGGHAENPLHDGVTLRPIFAQAGEETLRDDVIGLLEQQGHLDRSPDDVYTPDEEALIEERLRNLGYL